MSVDTNPVIWTEGSRFDRVLARIFQRIGSAFGGSEVTGSRWLEQEFLSARRVKTSVVTIELPRASAFGDAYEVEPVSAGDLRKIIAHDISRISPVRTEPVSTLAHRSPELGGRVALLHVHSHILEAIETHAAKLRIAQVRLSAEDTPEIAQPTPLTIAKTRRERQITLVAFVMLLAGGWALISAYNAQVKQTVLQLEADESLLRTPLLDRRSRERDLGALGELARRAPEQTSPQGIVAQIEALTAATPATAWWTELGIEGGVARLTGRSDKAGSTLSSVSQALPGHDVRFDAAVSDTSNEQQAFVIKVAPVGARDD